MWIRHTGQRTNKLKNGPSSYRSKRDNLFRAGFHEAIILMIWHWKKMFPYKLGPNHQTIGDQIIVD